MFPQPYQVDQNLATRWITFENPSGASGMGGRAASRLGVGRKGAPSKLLDAGETIQLCDVEGPGTIRHFWCSIEPTPQVLRGLVVRAWFDEQEHPSIECPLGDFMGLAHGRLRPYCSAVHSVGEKGTLNFWLPMPFTQRARITITNDGDHPTPLLFQLACTLGDQHQKEVGRLHCHFRRENPTLMGRDFELLPLRTGRGRFIGSVIGVRSLQDVWWGEGEVKVYLDGDFEFPTLCGTGSEDYVGLGFDARPTPYLHHGCSLRQEPFTSVYRWHLLDPILWKKDVRVTIQQIGREQGRLIETADDWSAASFWYEPTPSLRLPGIPDFEARTKDLVI
jgi:D-arabinan exo alpha-(1,3)/(1,5)-arabinofuranosidase (non-reducing end)